MSIKRNMTTSTEDEIIREFATKAIISRQPLAAGATIDPDRVARWRAQQVAVLRTLGKDAADTFARRNGIDPADYTPFQSQLYVVAIADAIRAATYSLAMTDADIANELATEGMRDAPEL